MATKFPKRIFVKREKDEAADFLVADENMMSLVDMGDKIRVGMYELVEIREITGVVSSRVVD